MSIDTPVGPRGVAPAAAPFDLAALTGAALSTAPAAVIAQPERPGVTAPWPDWVHPAVQQSLCDIGVHRLWQHQADAADALWRGRHVALATGTASGKSLSYWLPALTAALTDRATTLYCTPTKALAADQQARLAALDLAGVSPACYDGDTDREARPWIRRTSRFLLTNPDMLHRSMLPRPAHWQLFWRRLRFVVLDEAHMYRGVFGANVAAVVTRLRRAVGAAGGAEPTFVVCSATLGNPASLAGDLLGIPAAAITAVDADTSARGPRTIILHDPATLAAEAGQPVGSAFTETADVLAAWADAGVQSVGFVRSRAGVEAMAQAVRDRTSATPATAVAPYRGGLLPEERRDIERRLRGGQLRTVAATNALELGVDIAGLDAVAMCGWPGTRLSFFQQLGRAGRQGAPAVAVLSAAVDPLDRYYVHHPERIFDAPLEATVLDPANPYVLLGHLACAVAESPLTAAEAASWFGPSAADLLAHLADRGLVRFRGERWFWVGESPAPGLVDLRGNAGQLAIVDRDTGRVMGTVDAASAPAQLHPGAVYVHLGVVHLVESLDLDAGVALVQRTDPGYTTTAQSTSEVTVLDERESRLLGGGSVHFGDVQVTSQVVGFLRRDARTGTILGSEALAMPPSRLKTQAGWWCLPDAAAGTAGLTEATIPGAAHAAEHAAIGVLPALATCDRWDIGGLSTPYHPDTDTMTVFVYDGHPGGAGFARRGFDAAQQWLTATAAVITGCACVAGCPGCVQSPKCGNGNEPLDKSGAVSLLRAFVGK